MPSGDSEDPLSMRAFPTSSDVSLLLVVALLSFASAGAQTPGGPSAANYRSLQEANYAARRISLTTAPKLAAGSDKLTNTARAYAAALFFWAWPMMFILAIGTWRSHRRAEGESGAPT